MIVDSGTAINIAGATSPKHMSGGRSNIDGPPGRKEAPDGNRDVILGHCVIVI